MSYSNSAMINSLENISVDTQLSNKKLAVCTKCVMDLSDPDIQFDQDGVCNHCHNFEVNKARIINPSQSDLELAKLVTKIKLSGNNLDYDCVVGVSGGVDSVYSLYLAKKLGLRILAVHFDNGWNSELAVNNIEKILKKLDIDLYTYVVDWEEFKDVQLSFLKASTPDSEIPTDHAIFATLIKVAAKHGVKYVLCGTNFATESVYVEAWGYGHNDAYYIRYIHRLFGKLKMRTFPYYTIIDLFYYLLLRRIKFVSILNYIKYDKEEAIKILENELDWKYYGGKHHESVYTRFFQSYILPVKFSIDKRKSHLSALIYSGLMNRQQALEELKKPIASPEFIESDKQYIIKKFGITEEEFEKIMSLPIKSFKAYRSRAQVVLRLKRLQNWLRKIGFFSK